MDAMIIMSVGLLLGTLLGFSLGDRHGRRSERKSLAHVLRHGRTYMEAVEDSVLQYGRVGRYEIEIVVKPSAPADRYRDDDTPTTTRTGTITYEFPCKTCGATDEPCDAGLHS